MHLRKHTISFLPEQPGWCGNGGIRLSVTGLVKTFTHLCRTSLVLISDAMCLLVTNEQHKSYPSDLDMT